jgi:HNH endonuclease
MTPPFSYPLTAQVRRHGPQGYTDYASYRAWLRDEFSFRCGYCLQRERWVPGGFHLDHFLPVAHHSDAATEYTNLFFCCATCNVAKRDASIPDPTQHLLAQNVTVQLDGTVVAKTKEATRIIAQLGLNRPQYLVFRRVWLLIVQTIAAHPNVLREVLGFPADLPDLSLLRPPAGNTKPEGIEQSFFRQRQRGELPETY